MELIAQSSTTRDLLWASIITGGLAFVGTVIVAWLANRNRRTAKEVAAEILEALDTGNGHTAGNALARIEETQWRHERRLDSIEVEVRETRGEIEVAGRRLERVDALARQAVQQTEDHLLEVAPLAEWVKQQVEKEGEEP